MRTLTIQEPEETVLPEDTFGYWFNDRPDLRSPFPVYIQAELRYRTLEKFYTWLSAVNYGAGKEILHENYNEKLESILFEVALLLVRTDDERITVRYPLMPRIGDVLTDDRAGQEWGMSIVMKRELINASGKRYLRLGLKSLEKSVEWETEFDLVAN